VIPRRAGRAGHAETGSRSQRSSTRRSTARISKSAKLAPRQRRVPPPNGNHERPALVRDNARSRFSAATATRRGPLVPFLGTVIAATLIEHAGSEDRVPVAAEPVGVAASALEITVAYVKDRRQVGTPVGAFQAVSHRCAQMLLDTESARATVSSAAWAADADPSLLPEAAAVAKSAASDAGRDVTAAAIQLHGGIGLTWEADVH